MAYKERVCIVCGSTFQPDGPRAITCSKECSHILSNNRSLHYKRTHKEAKKIRTPEEDLNTIVTKAFSLGLSYGEYMTKRYFENKE